LGKQEGLRFQRPLPRLQRSSESAVEEPHEQRRLRPAPAVAVAVLPAESVTVSVTFSGWNTPSLVAPVLPHVSVNDNVGSVPVIVRVTS
jgi:hypothetical protein